MRCKLFPLRCTCLMMISLFGFLPCARAQEAAPEGPAATWQFEIPATDDGLPGAGPIRRYDWMQRVWNDRRTTFAKRSARDQGSVVFLGDSITQGWGDDFGGDFQGIKVANRGISGDTTRGMLIRMDQDVLALDPAGVVLLMGTNDLEEKADPATIAGNVGLIIDSIKQHAADVPIVLCLVMPSSQTKSRPTDAIKQINAALAEAVRGDGQVTVVDTWTLFAGKGGDAKTDEFPDLLHPNRLGYDKWALALSPIFDTLGLATPPADDFRPEPGFESLFNGKDLTGWSFRTTAEAMRKGRERWIKRDTSVVWPLVEADVAFDGQTATPEGRYVAKNGRLVVTTPPEGRKIQQLWTTRRFPGDFTLRLQFRAGVNADSGVFIRAPQLQCRDFVLAGPYKNLNNYRPQDWNDLEVVVSGGVARCTCNGEVLEEAMKVPPTGPIGLEGDRGQIEYRRIRIQTKS